MAKILAKAGQRGVLAGVLLEGSRLLAPLAGCDVYVISVSPSEPDAIWVFEAWRSEADHAASLNMDSLGAFMKRAKLLIAALLKAVDSFRCWRLPASIQARPQASDLHCSPAAKLSGSPPPPRSEVPPRSP
ncbi:MAG TPA: antibiotic biosynthesis monooxygenase family protein [Terriglobales bacterium]|nr:antibiotic biosynthesis monooxygenase family protein [Terriglobales bacterium]